jgi:hypothetical protein
MHTRERYMLARDACPRDACPRVISAEISSVSDPGCNAPPEALTITAEEEQLELFHKLLEGNTGASEVNGSEV